jgi:uncharacterized membrane protein
MKFARGQVLSSIAAAVCGAVAVVALITPLVTLRYTAATTYPEAATLISYWTFVVFVAVTLAKLSFQMCRIALAQVRLNVNRMHLVRAAIIYLDSAGEEATWEDLSWTMRDWNRVEGPLLDQVDNNIEGKIPGVKGVSWPMQ